jgi:2-oxoglutarate ferredoxin oxidoreductase subunit gamma
MTDSQQHKQGKKEIIITGFGGQGIVLAGIILGKAAAIGEHMESTLVQSYGPESRGVSCNAQVVISDEMIHYPYVSHPDILVCMSQSGYDKLIKQLKENGTLIIDQDLVRPVRGLACDFFSIPATGMAEELGRVMIANIIMIGFLTAVTNVISMDAAQKSVLESVPKGTEKLNTTAFKKGHDYGLATLKGRQKKAAGQAGAMS